MECLKKRSGGCPVLFASSTQAELGNAYGRSKREAERILRAYAAEAGTKTIIYRLPNVFGKWCRPEYNSVVATFCHHIAHGQLIRVDDARHELHLVYVDDVIASFHEQAAGRTSRMAVFCSMLSPSMSQRSCCGVMRLASAESRGHWKRPSSSRL